MGWSSGSEIADSLWATIEKKLSPKQKRAVAREWVRIFEVHDCDTMLETAVGEAAGIKNDEERGSYFPWQEED